jgi:large subunit ribosomal protein L15
MVRRVGKRSRRERGHRTHGYGAGKKHRGKGNKGGKGFAWDKHLWVYTLKYEPDHFGKFGFQSPDQKIRRPETINVGLLDATIETLLSSKLATREGSVISIDCGKLGIGKVLGGGKVTKALSVKCDIFSESAVKKLESAGGKAIAPEKKEKAPKPAKSPKSP